MFGHNEPFAYGGVLSGKNSTGVGRAGGGDDVALSLATGGTSFGPLARSTCSLCTSGISPTRCFSQEQMTIRQAHAEKAMHFRRENRINAGTLIVILRGAQDQSASFVLGAASTIN
ncbi:MAG: hypothetical protein DMF47_06650 [Verrucomicrobia bacterium]|nr:MAG: hypothetical protein DMF47_06650 [Verrucomicrobiota bacterium]